MVIEVPARELEARNPARYGVQQPQETRHSRPLPAKHEIMNDLVQQHGKIENCQPFEYGKGHPRPGLPKIEDPEDASSQKDQLSCQNQEVPPGTPQMQNPELVAAHCRGQLPL